MLLAGQRAPLHLTYCTNVYPGESWQALRDDILPRVVEVKMRLAPDRPFGVGLRVSAEAARALREPAARAELQNTLRRQGLYVFTLNGFPFGDFHGAHIKERVYAPDFRSEARLSYTRDLADLLAFLLPSSVSYGSISTVPFGFGLDFREADAWEEATHKLIELTASLYALEASRGRRIVLALEPEPECALATSAHSVTAFERYLRAPSALATLAERCGVERGAARAILDRYLGICVDACHAAVEFEDASALFARLEETAIPVFKVQLSAGVIADPSDPTQRAALASLCNDPYLHQVVARRAGELTHYTDLPNALAAHTEHDRAPAASERDEWRVHLHVPIYTESLGVLRSTRPMLSELCASLRQSTACEHFEVETYTWNVLPPEMRGASLRDDVVRELRWVLDDSGLVDVRTP